MTVNLEVWESGIPHEGGSRKEVMDYQILTLPVILLVMINLSP